MNFRIDDVKEGPEATKKLLNPWAAAIRWILEWIDAQPTNATTSPPALHQFIVIENGAAVIYEIPANHVGPAT